MGYFLGSGKCLKTIFGSTHVVEQLYFYMIPSILTFEFDLILGSILTFWSPNGLFCWSFLTFWGPSGLFLSSG